MPNVDNTLVGYINGAWCFVNAEGEATEYETEFIPDWRVDNDPRLVADYVGCLSEQYLDRNNDVYLDDVKTCNSGSRKNEDKSYAGHYGYDVVPAPAHIVRCWYCPPTSAEVTYVRDYFGKDEASAQQGFVTAMLVHYYEHRSNGDLPYVTTYFPGKEIRRPNGTLVANKPGVVRTWRINGKLVSG